jgi:hypothetical protein
MMRLLGLGLADGRTGAPGCSGRRSFGSHAQRVSADSVISAGKRRGRARDPRAARPRRAPGVGLVVHPARVGHRHVPVLLEVVHRALRRVDRQMGEVGTAEPLELGVEVGEVAALQQRIVRRSRCRARRSGCRTRPARSRRRSCRRPGRAPAADDTDRHLLLGMILVASSTSNANLSAKASSKTCTPSSHSGSRRHDRVPQVAAVEVRVGAVDLDRLVPHDRLQALLRLPVELDEGRLCPRRRPSGRCGRRSPP